MKEKKKAFRKETRSADVKKNYIHRLSRIEGQIRGIGQMIEDDRSYDDIVTQVLSAVNALKGISNHLIKDHMTDNVLPILSKEKQEELTEVLNWLDKVK